MKKLATALGFALAVVAIAALYLWRDLDTQRQRNSETQARVTALESANVTQSVAAPSAAVGTQLAAVSPVEVAQAEAMPSASTTAQSPARGANPLAAMVEQFENSSEGMEFQRIMMRQRLEQKYPDLAKEMNLSPEKAGKLLDLLARREIERSKDDMSDSQSGGRGSRAAREELARSRAKRQQAYQSELSALLGSSYSKWPEYEQMAGDRQRAGYERLGQEEIRNAINSSGTPLTDAQFQYLKSALDAEQKRIDQETTSVQQQRQRLPETNRRLVGVAAAHLNPQQLERYQGFLKQQEEMMQMIEAAGGLR